MDGVGLATRFFDALERSDFASIEAMCAPELSIWHNYDLKDRTRAQMINDLSKMDAAFAEFHYQERRYEALPDGAWVEHLLVGVTVDGRPIKIPMAARLTLNESSLIKRIREYGDAAQVRQITSGRDIAAITPPA